MTSFFAVDGGVDDGGCLSGPPRAQPLSPVREELAGLLRKSIQGICGVSVNECHAAKQLLAGKGSAATALFQARGSTKKPEFFSRTPASLWHALMHSQSHEKEGQLVAAHADEDATLIPQKKSKQASALLPSRRQEEGESVSTHMSDADDIATEEARVGPGGGSKRAQKRAKKLAEKMMRKQRLQQHDWKASNSSTGEESRETLSCSATTEFGRTKEAVFASLEEFAQAIVEGIEEHAPPHLIGYIRATPSGTIEVSSLMFIARQQAHDRLMCRSCGIFCAHIRGLRDHQQREHKESYEESQAVAQEASVSIVAYERDGIIQQLMRRWKDEAKQAEAARSSLPVALKAAKDGDLMALRSLPNARLFAVDRHGSSLLHWAAGSGQLEICRWYIEDKGGVVTHTQQKSGRGALHWAARNGHQEVCSFLVEKGSDVNQGTVDGTPPLHWAVWQNHEGVCDLLVQKGANVFAKNAFGCNAVQWAAQGGHVQMCEWLMRHGVDFSLLNNNGHSAFHKAAIYGHRGVCRWLHEQGGLGLKHLEADMDGNTPMEMARLNGHSETYQYLAKLHASLAASSEEPIPEPVTM